MIVVWRITQRCNLSCPFCEWDKTLPRPRANVAPERVRRFGKILGDYQRETGDRVLLSWLGGEPTLWPALYELAPELKRMGIAQSMTTNGTTLHSAAVQTQILDNFSEVTISVDGFAEFHDSIRGWKGGWEQLRESVKTIAAARVDRNSLKLRCNVVLMRDNFADFAKLCHELAAWGMNEITFNALGGRDRPEFFPDHRLRPQDTDLLASKVPALRRELSDKGVSLCGGTDYVARISASARDEQLNISDCGPGQKFLFIDENGICSPCNFTTSSYGVCVDEIDCVEDVVALPARFVELRTQAPAAACRDCPSTQVFAKFAV